MSIKYMSAVWDNSDLTGSERMVLLSLADNANDEGICWPSINTISRKVNLSRRQTIYILNNLVTQGYLVKEPRNRDNGSNQSNLYIIQLQPQKIDVILPNIPLDTPPSEVDCTPPSAIDNTTLVQSAAPLEPPLEPSLREPQKEKTKDRRPPHVSSEFSKNENSNESLVSTDFLKDKNIHPIIRQIKEITGYYPKKETWFTLQQMFPGGITDMVYAKDCFVEWVAKGFNPENLDWLIDWYKNKKYYQHPKEKERWKDLLHPEGVEVDNA